MAYGRQQQISGGRFRPQAWPPLSAVSDNCLGTQHAAVWPRRRVVLQRQTQIVRRYSTHPACTAQAATRRHFAIRSQGRVRSARYKDGYTYIQTLLITRTIIKRNCLNLRRGSVSPTSSAGSRRLLLVLQH